MVSIDIISEESPLVVLAGGLNGGGLLLGDTSGPCPHEDEPVDHIVILEEFALYNLQHLLIIYYNHYISIGTGFWGFGEIGRAHV